MKSLLLTAMVLAAPAAGAQTLPVDLAPSEPAWFEVGTPEAVERACKLVMPTVRNDSVTTAYGTRIHINLFANDTNTSLGLGYVLQPYHGTVLDLGGGWVRYTPGLGFSGIDTFVYGALACHQCFDGWCSEPDLVDGRVTVTVTP